MEIEIYTDKDKELWDNFVKSSKNGTFLFYRNFMEYHSDRFNDYSFIFYKDDNPIALLPGNVKNGIYYSHQGLTYGGLIMNNDISASDVLKIFESLILILKHQGIKEIIYKPVPHIYHQHPAEEDLYALFINKAQLISRGIASAIDLKSETIPYSSSRFNGLKKAEKAGLYVQESDDFAAFWEILSDNLQNRFTSRPVHSVDEIKLLNNRFKDNIKLFGVFNSNHQMIGGEVMFYTDQVAHAQYTAATEEGKKQGAIDLVIDYIIKDASITKRYFDYGISTENNGMYLNEGLITQKEGFGARAIVYDIYSLKLS